VAAGPGVGPSSGQAHGGARPSLGGITSAAGVVVRANHEVGGESRGAWFPTRGQSSIRELPDGPRGLRGQGSIRVVGRARGSQPRVAAQQAGPAPAEPPARSNPCRAPAGLVGRAPVGWRPRRTAQMPPHSGSAEEHVRGEQRSLPAIESPQRDQSDHPLKAPPWASLRAWLCVGPCLAGLALLATDGSG